MIPRKQVAPLSPASLPWHEEDSRAQSHSQPSGPYWSQLGEGGHMHVIPVGAACPSPWVIPSLRPFPDEMSHGNKQHQCRQHLETTFHSDREVKPRVSGTRGWDTFTPKRGKVSRPSTCCGPHLAFVLAIGTMSPSACGKAQGVLPW